MKLTTVIVLFSLTAAALGGDTTLTFGKDVRQGANVVKQLLA